MNLVTRGPQGAPPAHPPAVDGDRRVEPALALRATQPTTLGTDRRADHRPRLRAPPLGFALRSPAAEHHRRVAELQREISDLRPGSGTGPCERSPSLRRVSRARRSPDSHDDGLAPRAYRGRAPLLVTEEADMSVAAPMDHARYHDDRAPLARRRVARRRERGDDSGSEGGGPGWGRRRRPPSRRQTSPWRPSESPNPRAKSEAT